MKIVYTYVHGDPNRDSTVAPAKFVAEPGDSPDTHASASEIRHVDADGNLISTTGRIPFERSTQYGVSSTPSRTAGCSPLREAEKA